MSKEKKESSSTLKDDASKSKIAVTSKEKKKSIRTFIITVILMAIGITIAVVGTPTFTSGLKNTEKFVGKASNIILGLELRGGASVKYQIVGRDDSKKDSSDKDKDKDKKDENKESKQENKESKEVDISKENMEDTIRKLQERAETFSTESSVFQEGDKRIVVEIPGITSDDDAFKSLAEVGTIQFRTDCEKDEKVKGGRKGGKVVLDGNDIGNAEAAVAKTNKSENDNIISLEFTSEGKKKFADVTTKLMKSNGDREIAIFYNDECICSPQVQSAITDGRAQIDGMESKKKAEEIASYIRIGALPVELEQLSSSTVTAQLGADALETSLIAGGIGLLAVIIFMIIVYKVPGVVASIAVCVYGVIELLLLNWLDITLTLPGIAGIILSIGMAVDANVIIFTRIKEEIGLGKSVKSAIEIGFDKALSAILDGNITTLIAAIVLGMKGSGTVKGFAYTLGLGIIVSMFSALFVTRKLMWAFYNIGCRDEKFYGKKSKTKIIDFVGNKLKYFIISGAIIVAGIVAMIVSYNDSGEIFEYGLDFKGGTSITIDFDGADKVPSSEELEKFFAGNDINLKAVAAAEANSKKVNVKVEDLSKKEELREKINDKLKEKYKVDTKKIGDETVSGTVSDEMKENALLAVTYATIAMLIYIWFRFKKISFALGSVIPLIHDCFIVLSIYALSKITVGNTFIACMLTLVGYSINATIVIFDRIRESKASAKTKEEKKALVNEAISQTLTRSINTSLTTFISIFALYILGVKSIKEFTLPLMAGIIAGGYSSVCIAGTIWYILDRGKSSTNTKKDVKKKETKEEKEKILV